MPREISAGAIIFRRENGKILYLLLHYPAMDHRSSKDFWDFAKGHVEVGESVAETIRREIKEETGIDDLEFVAGFKETIKYFFIHEEKRIFKIVIFLLAQSKTKEVKISGEHTTFIWLPFNEAHETVTYANAKQLLQKANKFLCQKE